jgi:predicted DNA-binding ribbon-helix-helix protein
MLTAWQPRPRSVNSNSLSTLAIHNVVVAGRRTSVRLEPAMWEALRDVASRLGVTIHDLVTRIDRERSASSLTAAIRVYVVDFYRAAFLGEQPVILEPMPLPLRHGDC